MEITSPPWQSLAVPVTDPTQVGEARRKAASMAQRLGFAETEAGQVSIVISEGATNIIKFAKSGQIILRPLFEEHRTGIEMLILDQGPGMDDIQRCLKDGFSTAGSSGTGLGAIQRLSSTFDIYSAPDRGTAILSRIWNKQPACRSNQKFSVGSVCIPHPSEIICGDSWQVSEQEEQLAIVVADGLGHGSAAAEAAVESVRVFGETRWRPGDFLTRVHGALQKTRGAAVSIADIQPARSQLTYCGIGNISGRIFTGYESRSLVSHNGTVGLGQIRVQEFNYPWSSNAVLILHSDGIHSRWNLDPYQGLIGRHPSLIAGVIYRDFKKGYDDVTVVVARES